LTTKSQKTKNKNELKLNLDSEKPEVSEIYRLFLFLPMKHVINYFLQDFQGDMPMTFHSENGIVWNRIAVLFSDAALLKFQQDNHMIVDKHQIWKCNLLESSNKYSNKKNCPYL
jgi:hypothetical protein